MRLNRTRIKEIVRRKMSGQLGSHSSLRNYKSRDTFASMMNTAGEIDKLLDSMGRKFTVFKRNYESVSRSVDEGTYSSGEKTTINKINDEIDDVETCLADLREFFSSI